MKFKVSGSFKLGEFTESFSKVVSAVNERAAVEKVMSLLGSNHRLQRRFINVEEVVNA